MVLLEPTAALRHAVEYLHRAGELPNPDLVPPSCHPPAKLETISHENVVAISKRLRAIASTGDQKNAGEIPPHSLDKLLRGSRIYVAPPKVKKGPTSEYKALMDRLRKEEEARAYERMINPPAPAETFADRFPGSQTAKLFSPGTMDLDDDDEMSYADVNRQMTLIINIIVSVVACSIGLWLVARHWSTPSRLALSMIGSVLIAIAEAVVYSGYLRRVQESRAKDKKEVEVKEIIKTWVIGDDKEATKTIPIGTKQSTTPHLRKRLPGIS